MEASAEEILVIYMLSVAAKHAGKGYAKRMVRFVIEMAEELGMKAVRLDAMKGSLPAERLYPAVGFMYRNTVQMYYPDVGWSLNCTSMWYNTQKRDTL